MNARSVLLIVVVLLLVCSAPPLYAQSCAPGIRFVADVTVPDDTVYQPNAPFEKIWKFENSGSCDWTDDFALVFIDGDQLSAESPQRLGRTVAVGQTTDVGIVMRAPADVGTYTSRWQLQDVDGNPVGDPFYVRIRVMQPTAPEATISSPADGSAIRGLVQVLGSAVHPAFDYYKLEFGPGETPADSQMTVAGRLMRDQVLQGVLGEWDTTGLDDGVYSLRLRVVDRNGNYVESWVRNLTLNNAGPEPLPTKRAVAAPTETSTATLTATPTATVAPTEMPSGPAGPFADDVVAVMTAIAGGGDAQMLLDALAATHFPGAEPTVSRPTATVLAMPSPTATEVPPTIAPIPSPEPPAATPTATVPPTTTALPTLAPTETPTTKTGGGFIGVTGKTPTAQMETPTRQAQSGFIGTTGKMSDEPVQPIAQTQFEPQNGLQVTSVMSYTDSFGYMYVVGEALNVGNVPLTNVDLELVLLGADGSELGVNDYSRVSLDVVPVDGKLPFSFSIDEAMQNWTSVDFVIDARPYDPAQSFFQPVSGLSVANIVEHPTEADFGSFGLTGKVVNSGSEAARSVNLVVVAYDENGRVVDANSSPSALDLIPSGGTSPFELALDGSKHAPYRYEIVAMGREDPDAAVQQAQVPFKVTQLGTYTNDWGQLYVVGEAVNEGALPAWSVRAVASLLDADGNVLDLSSANWAGLEYVEPGAIYPFSFFIADDAGEWKDVALQVQAYPFNEEQAYFTPHRDLAAEDVVAVPPETDYDELKYTGVVVNNGTVPAEYVNVVIVAHGPDGAVVDAGNSSVELDEGVLAPGAQAPFELAFSGIKEAPTNYELFVTGRQVENE